MTTRRAVWLRILCAMLAIQAGTLAALYLLNRCMP